MTPHTPKIRLREAIKPSRRLLLSMGRKIMAPPRQERGWTAAKRRARRPPGVRAEMTKNRRVEERAKPIMKALGIKLLAPINRVTMLNKMKNKIQRLQAERLSAAHLLGVKSPFSLKRWETSRSEKRDGRVKAERAKRRARRLKPLDREKERPPPTSVTETCSIKRVL